MSVFTSRVTKEIAIPHDEGQTATIRKLAPRHLEAAAKEAQRQSLADLRDMGGAAFMRELQSLNTGDTVARAAVADPLGTFDRLTLLEKGVTGWSYDVPVGREAFEDLDDDTAEFLAREVLRLAKPALFQTEAEAEAARGNG
jgi:hypothetical protein